METFEIDVEGNNKEEKADESSQSLLPKISYFQYILHKIIQFMLQYGYKVTIVGLICISVIFIIVYSVFVSYAVPVSQINEKLIVSLIQGYVISITYIIDYIQIYYFKLPIRLSTYYEKLLLFLMSGLYLVVITLNYFAVSYTNDYFGSAIIIVSSGANGFLFYVGIGMQETLKSIDVVRPKFLTSFSKISNTRDSSNVSQHNIGYHSLYESAINNMDKVYFRLQDYSIFLRNRLIYSIPSFLVSLLLVLIRTDIFTNVVLVEIPYFVVVFLCIQLNLVIENYESVVGCETDLNVKVVGVNIKHTWLISVIASLSSLIFKVGILDKSEFESSI